MHVISIHSGSGEQSIVITEFTPCILLAMCWVQGKMRDLGDGHFEISFTGEQDAPDFVDEDEALEFLGLQYGGYDDPQEFVELIKGTWHVHANHY